MFEWTGRKRKTPAVPWAGGGGAERVGDEDTNLMMNAAACSRVLVKGELGKFQILHPTCTVNYAPTG